MPISTFNWAGVGKCGGDGLFMLTPPRVPFTPEEAIILAAWLVVLADGQEKIAEAIRAVEET